MADDTARVDDDDQGPVSAAHIVRTTARLVENAHDGLGDWFESSGVPASESGPVLDALTAMGAAAPLMRLIGEGIGGADQTIREQDALRGRAVSQIADTMAGDLADVLGRPASEPVPPWNTLLRIVRAMVVEDADPAPEIPQSAVIELALAIGWSESDVRDVPGSWARLLRVVRGLSDHPAPTPILSTRMVLDALGYDSAVAGRTWSPSNILDAIRSTRLERNAAVDAAAAERDRINLWANQLATLLFGQTVADDWGTPNGLGGLMHGVRQVRTTLDADVLDVATALAYRNPDARPGQLPTRADWPKMMRDLATLRQQPAEMTDELAAALGNPDASEVGGSFDDMLDAVRALAEQHDENANQVPAVQPDEGFRAGPPPDVRPAQDWSAMSENLFEARPRQQVNPPAHPVGDDGHGPDDPEHG